MSAPSADLLEEVVEQVRSSEKYAAIDKGMVRSIASVELHKRRSLKEAVKATRNKLHQVGSAYQEKPIPYAAWQAELKELPADLNAEAVKTFLSMNMHAHASTSERLSIHETFFMQTLVSLGPLHSVLDLACGLNPLNLPWMPVAPEFSYSACDIYQDMSDYLNTFFQHFSINGSAALCDLTRTIPQQTAQLALLLKTIPCLEQIDKSAGQKLLDGLQTENILVSFPAHSLSGRAKGMVQNYETHFMQLVAGKHWQITRFEYPGELAFLIRK